MMSRLTRRLRLGTAVALLCGTTSSFALQYRQHRLLGLVTRLPRISSYGNLLLALLHAIRLLSADLHQGAPLHS